MSNVVIDAELTHIPIVRALFREYWDDAIAEMKRLYIRCAVSREPGSGRVVSRERDHRVLSSGVRSLIFIALVCLACTRGPAPPAPPVATPVASPAVVPKAAFDVVFVGANDVLNVRATPTADAALVHALAHDARGVRATGEETVVGSARWVKLETPSGAGWANASYLSTATSSTSFVAEEMIGALAKGDLAPLLGPRGLYVFDYGTERHFAAAALASAQKSKWNGPGCGENCREGTFHEIIGAPLAEVLARADHQLATDRILKGGNASARPPAKLANLRYVSVLDPGTVAHDHLDWRAFTLYFEPSESGWKWVAIVPDQWSP